MIRRAASSTPRLRPGRNFSRILLPKRIEPSGRPERRAFSAIRCDWRTSESAVLPYPMRPAPFTPFLVSFPQRRTYIFLPTVSEFTKLLRDILSPKRVDNSSTTTTENPTTAKTEYLKLTLKIRDYKMRQIARFRLKKEISLGHAKRNSQEIRTAYLSRKKKMRDGFHRRLSQNNLLASTIREKVRQRLREGGVSFSREKYYGWSERTVVIEEPAKRAWFDDDGYPLTSRNRFGRFVNPWNSESSNGIQTLENLWKWKKERWFHSEGVMMEPPQGSEGVFCDGEEDENSSPLDGSMNEEGAKLTWIGHSTCLVSMHGFTILTDPMFSQRASILQCPGIGVPRYTPPALSVQDIVKERPIDVVMISHDHYDHLDVDSIVCLRNTGRVKYWCVPLGIKEWLVHNCQVPECDIVEMEWWEQATFYKLINGEEEEMVLSTKDNDNTALDAAEGMYSKMITLTCAPSHHWSCRTPLDRNLRLWCSWAAKTTLFNHDTDGSHTSTDDRQTSENNNNNTLNFYFAGDTGLPPKFPLHQQIGDRLGPFDLAALPIGAYSPSFFMRHSHCNPDESAKIHVHLRSKKSVAIHWGTFAMADEPFFEPPLLLKRALDNIGLGREEFVAIGHGDCAWSGEAKAVFSDGASEESSVF